MIENIAYQNNNLVIIIRSSYSKDGIEFFTPNEFSQQLAYMKRPQNYCIQPHKQNAVPRKLTHTQEVLSIKSGKVRIDFYDNNKSYLQSQIHTSGDVIVLASGGHGLRMLKKLKLLRLSRGPILKTRTKHVSMELVKIKIRSKFF